MTNGIATTESEPEQKLTAEQIENDCPARLEQIGKEITERLAKADKQTEEAQNHLIAVQELLVEARNLCDDNGFKKFHELVCPQLGKSQAYALLAIADGKKTLAEHRVEERVRKRRTRAKKKEAGSLSGTVPENPQPSSELHDFGTDDVEVETKNSAQEAPEPTKSRGAVTPKDDALIGFSSAVLELIRRTRKQRPKRFAATLVAADDIVALGGPTKRRNHGLSDG